jgi:hypothetical protein
MKISPLFGTVFAIFMRFSLFSCGISMLNGGSVKNTVRSEWNFGFWGNFLSWMQWCNKPSFNGIENTRVLIHRALLLTDLCYNYSAAGVVKGRLSLMQAEVTQHVGLIKLRHYNVTIGHLKFVSTHTWYVWQFFYVLDKLSYCYNIESLRKIVLNVCENATIYKKLFSGFCTFFFFFSFPDFEIKKIPFTPF